MNIISTNPTYTFTAQQNRTLTAVFALDVPMYTITATIDPAGSGTVTGAGQYAEGAQATITATPGEGYKFTGWQEDGVIVSESESYTFTVTGNRTFVAGFEEISAGRLPGGYTEVEYISPDAPNTAKRPYIGTELYFPNVSRIVMDIFTESYDNGYSGQQRIFDAGANYLIGRYPSTTVRYALGTRTTSTVSYAIPSSRMIFEFDVVKKTVSFGATTFKVSVYDDASGDSIAIYGKYSFTFPFELYSAQFYDKNDTKLGDFVPCINSNGEIGLYDLIGGKFYANAGTGAFTAGPAI